VAEQVAVFSPNRIPAAGAQNNRQADCLQVTCLNVRVCNGQTEACDERNVRVTRREVKGRREAAREKSIVSPVLSQHSSERNSPAEEEVADGRYVGSGDRNSYLRSGAAQSSSGRKRFHVV
jgi:hypothetical protein